MGLRIRKSAKFGPLRINLSKSGVGYSVGGRGFRVTKKSNGGLRTTASAPGTGISYVKETSGKSHATPSQNHYQPKHKSKWPYVLIAVAVGLWAIFFLLLFASCNTSKEPSPPIISSELPVSSVSTSQQGMVSSEALEADTLKLAENVFPPDAISHVKISDLKAEVFTLSSSDSIVWNEAEKAAQEASKTILETLGLDYAIVYIQDESGYNLLTVINGKTSYSSQSTTQADENTVTSNSQSHEEFVWVSENGTKYHSISSCSNMQSPRQISLSSAIASGYTACKKCH